MIFELKKGNPSVLFGKVVAYCKIKNFSGPKLQNHPVAGMVNRGLLCVSGDYRSSQSIRDFFKEELGISLEEGLKNLFSQFKGEEPDEPWNQNNMEEKLDNLKAMEEFIPKPAKMELFNSEEEILGQEGDIYFLGEFENLGYANLMANAFPVIYQAQYKEQRNRALNSEISKMLEEISQKNEGGENFETFTGNLENELLTKYVPALYYEFALSERKEEAQTNFRNFLKGYPHPDEIDQIIQLIKNEKLDPQKKAEIVELHIKKISSLIKEDFESLGIIKKKLDSFYKNDSSSTQ